jgi:hypothetical protein
VLGWCIMCHHCPQCKPSQFNTAIQPRPPPIASNCLLSSVRLPALSAPVLVGNKSNLADYRGCFLLLGGHLREGLPKLSISGEMVPLLDSKDEWEIRAGLSNRIEFFGLAFSLPSCPRLVLGALGVVLEHLGSARGVLRCCELPGHKRSILGPADATKAKS